MCRPRHHFFLLLPFSHFTVEAHLTLPRLPSQWEQRSYGTLCTHKCCATEQPQLEQSGFSQRTGHADLSSSRKYARPCGIRCPVFSSNGKLDDRCSRGTRWIFQPSFPWNNMADRVELVTGRKAVMPKKGLTPSDLLVWTTTSSSAFAHQCRLRVSYYHSSQSSAGTQPPENWANRDA